MPRSLFFFLAFCLLFFAETAFVFAYLRQEQSVPFWDYAMYADMAMGWFNLKGSNAFWPFFRESFSQNYNLLFALPSFVSFSLFSPSRSLFIATNFIVFGFAYQAATAFALRRVFALSWPIAIGAAMASCFALPFLWYPLLEGYPDHAAAACFVAALGLGVNKETRWFEAVLIGALLGLAIILRRYFVYPVFALLGASFLFDLYAFLLARSSLSARHFFPFYSLLGGTLAFVLLGFEGSYVRTMFVTDFLSLYQSYSRGFVYFVRFLSGHFGFLLLLSVFAGYGFIWYKGGTTRKNAAFVFLVFVLWLLLWVLGPSQASHHYISAVAPFFCAVGLVGLFLHAKHKPVVLGLAALLFFNTSLALWLSPSFLLPNELPSFSFFSAPRPPWIRQDRDELDRLVSYLEQTTTDKDRIAVVASSFILNQDLLRVIAQELALPQSFLNRFLFVPEVDLLQPPPFDAFASATVYVVPSPPQFHLGPKGQKGLVSFSSFFPPDSFFSSFFKADARVFQLDKNVSAALWRRASWTPEALHLGLAKLRKKHDSPGAWFSSRQASGLRRGKTSTKEDFFLLSFSPQAKTASLFHDYSLSAGRYKIGFAFSASSGCAAPVFTLRLEKKSGGVLAETSGSPLQNQGIHFAILRTEEALSFSSLAIEVSATKACFLSLWNLSIEKLP